MPEKSERTAGIHDFEQTFAARVNKPKRAIRGADASWFVASVRGLVEKNRRELPRIVDEDAPTPAEASDLLERLKHFQQSADRLASVLRNRDHDPMRGPSGVFGTYVVIYRLNRTAKRIRIGRLGTFDFPPGIYAYVGSAFGPSGVGGRTGRHFTRRSNEKWNIDWLKPLCTPVAMWWTHDRRKVEFDWAEALGSLPGASFPAPRFGAADNPRAEAHLVRFGELPAPDAFR